MRADEFLDGPTGSAADFLDGPGNATAAPTGFADTLKSIVSAALASKPVSVLESAEPQPQAFDMRAASVIRRMLDDNTERQKQYGTIGPIIGPQPSATTVAKGLVSDLVAGGKAARAGVNQMAADLTGSDYLQQQARRERGQADLMTAVNTPEFESDTARGLYGGLSSMVRQAPSFAAGMLMRNPSVALGGMVAPMLPDQYGEFRARGAEPAQALAGAAGTTATEYLTEKMPMGFLVNKLGKVGAGEFLTGLLAREVPSEQIATLVQDAIDTAVANPEKSWGDYLAERPNAAYQTLLATATQAGLMGAANRLAQPAQAAQPTAEDYAEAARRIFGVPPAPISPQAAAPAPSAPAAQQLAELIASTATQQSPLQPVVEPAPAAPSIAPQPATSMPEALPVEPVSAQQFLDAGAVPAPSVAVSAEPTQPVSAAQFLDGDTQAAPRAAPSEADDVLPAPGREGAPAQSPGTAAARVTPPKASATVQAPERYGVDHVPFSDGGKPFKTKLSAIKAKKLQPSMRIVSVEGGYALADKTPAQLAAQAKAAKRLGGVGAAGPLAAHEFIASEGGLSREAAQDLGLDRNVRVGARWLLAGPGKGLTIEQAAEKLHQAGYTPDELHNTALDMIRRSITHPQYTPEGWEQIAQAEQQARFEDHLAAHHEQPDDFALSDADLADMTASSDSFNAHEEEELRAALAAAEADGIDTEDLLARAAQITENGTHADYIREATDRIAEARNAATSSGGTAARAGSEQGRHATGGQDRESGGPGDGRPHNEGATGGQGDLAAQEDDVLTSYTPADIEDRLSRLERAEQDRKRQDREADQRAQADAQRDDFTLTGSDSEADQAAARGQRGIFDAQEPGAEYQPGDADVVKNGGGAHNAEAPKQAYRRDERQLELFLDRGPVESQAGAAGEAAQRRAVSAVDDLRSTGTVLGLALSRDYAARQRVNLVGQKVSSPEDLAVLAQVYRDPRFETFRVIFTNNAGRVVSQVGLTSRMPASTAVLMGNDIDAYLKELAATARNRGAAKFYLLHNHPSGNPTPSGADIALTRNFASKMPDLEFVSHIVIDTNKYATIERNGDNEIHDKDFGQPEPMTFDEWGNTAISGPVSVMDIARRLQVDKDAVTIISLTSQMTVKGITTIPHAAFGADDASNRRILSRAVMRLEGARVIAVGRDMETLKLLSDMTTDGIHIADNGMVTSLAQMGQGGGGSLFPRERRTRVSPDTSPEFGYLRAFDKQPSMKAAEPAGEQTDTPAFRRWFGSSKVVDTEGKPLMVYHGTDQSFDEFNGESWFTPSAKDASNYSNVLTRDAEHAPNVMPVFLAIRKPKIISFYATRADIAKAKSSGKYDGVIVRDVGGGKTDHYVVFRPEQVKSATGNSGEFDPSNPSIVREPGADYVAQSALDLGTPKRTFEPIRARDFLNVEPTATGRKQWVAGRKAYDRASAYATDYLGRIRLADNTPPIFRQMMRQFRIDQAKATETARAIAEKGRELAPEQRVMLSDMIEKEAHVGDVPPQDMVALAASISTALDQQAKELVGLGMLSEDRLVKNYLPRLYKTPLAAMLNNQQLIRSWFTKARLKIRGDRLKGRGLVNEVPIEKVKLAMKFGWKVARENQAEDYPEDFFDEVDRAGVGQTKYPGVKVLMWRDYTEQERADMGEVRDGVLRYAMGYVETQRDVAVGRLFRAIADNYDLARPFNPGGDWVKVPADDVPGAPGTKQYGALASMFVQRQVADALRRNTQPKGVLMAAYEKALSWWKEGKTVWNPVSHGNNVVSNLFTVHFAGINPADPRRWRDTLREFRAHGKHWQEAADMGLFGAEFARLEIEHLLTPDLASMADLETVAASRVSKMVDFLKKYPGKPLSWYREKMQRAYEVEDQFFKLMIYMDRRAAGMSPEDAVIDSERYIFNYADLPEGVELIKRTASPFFAYTYKAIPMLVHTAMTRPDRLLAPIALLGGANWLSYLITGGDEDKERKALPEYLEGRSVLGTQKAVRMPFNVEGKPAFMDMTRRVPLGDLFDMDNQTNGLPVPAPFMPSHPVLSSLAAVIWNVDTFTGRDLVKKSDTDWEAARERASYLYKQMVPNSPIVPGSYSFNKVMDAAAYTFDTEMGPYTGRTRSGEAIPLGVALPDVLTGTKIRAVDPDKGLEYKRADIQREEREIKANISSARRNQSMTDVARERYVTEQQDKLQELARQRTALYSD